MIRVRIDDVANESSSWDREGIIRQNLKLISWLSNVPDLVYQPMILVEDIQQFPEIVEALKEKTSPQFHGYMHIDYSQLPTDRIREHLSYSREWFFNTFGYGPKIWATPWGQWRPHLADIAFEYDFKDVESLDRKNIIHHTTEGTWTEPLIPPGAGLEKLVKGEKNFTVFCHWYDKGLNLRRIAEYLKHGPKAKEIYDWW